MTPFDDFAYLINHVVLGDEPSIEDFILLIGTLVAFVAFILWCCFPITPKLQQEANNHKQFACKSNQQHNNSTSLASGQVHHNSYSKTSPHSTGYRYATHTQYN